MAKTITATIRDRVAVRTNGTVYVCGNSDFTLEIDFDSEWDEYDTKTARFVYGGTYQDVEFQGNTCQVPIIFNTLKIHVGIFAGDLWTTTPVLIEANKSILCRTVNPAEPLVLRGQGDGLTTTEKNLLLSLFRNTAYTADMSAIIDRLVELWSSDDDSGEGETPGEPEKTLVSISASYTGGNVVIETALSDLNDIVVVAYYSDGSTVAVTDYTLSGTIAAGRNTITVSYGGMTTTFVVTGEEPAAIVYSVTNNLSHASTNNVAATIREGSVYVATITPDDGYELDTVTITMGGTDVTSSVYSNGGINIPSVTGDVVITVVAVEEVKETVEYALTPTWTSRPDKTTYEYTTIDMSGGSSQAVYQQMVSFIQSETSGGTLYVDVDTTKVSQMRFRLFIWDNEGNPYKHSSGMNGPISGDVTDAPMSNPGENDYMTHANGSWSYRIPDGCKVLLIVHPNTDDFIDEALTSAAKPIYAFVDAVTFDHEIITAKIVKEV